MTSPLSAIPVMNDATARGWLTVSATCELEMGTAFGGTTGKPVIVSEMPVSVALKIRLSVSAALSAMFGTAELPELLNAHPTVKGTEVSGATAKLVLLNVPVVESVHDTSGPAPTAAPGVFERVVFSTGAVLGAAAAGPPAP